VENLDKMNNFLKRYQIPNLIQDQINHLNSPISPKEMETIINSLPTKQNKQTNKKQAQMGLVQSSVRH
jgi:hypothetical protein